MTTAKQSHVVHASGWYLPYQVGGTEVYVQDLVEELGQLGMKSTVLVPRAPAAPVTYEHARTRVETYPVNEILSAGELRGDARHQGFDAFQQILERYKGAIYHQHSWTRGCGLPHLRAAKGLGLATVITVHVPSNVCLRGTMRRFGGLGCDGRIDPKGCGSCWAQGQGVPTPLAKLVGEIPLPIADVACRSGVRLGTLLGARMLASEKQTQLRQMINAADRVVAVCGWVHDALVANGVPRHKLVLSRQGISPAFERSAAEARERGPRLEGSKRLELLYVGTFNSVKGIDVAVNAVRSLPETLPVRLTIRAPSGGPEQQAYEARVRVLAGEDPRISFGGPVARDAVAQVMRSHDALVVPSVWMETGPLVVLEAQAVGLFVLGSALGGIAELVREPTDGELIPPGDVASWAAAIRRLASRVAARPMRHSPQQVRTMKAVATEMAQLYRGLERKAVGEAYAFPLPTAPH